MILSVCDNADILSTMRIIKIIIQIIKIVVPIILIISLMVTYTKATASGDNDLIAKANKQVVPKIVAALAIFLVPTFVGIIANLSANSLEYMKCIANANEKGIDNAYAEEVNLSLDNLSGNITTDEYNRVLSDVEKIQDPTLRQQALNKLKTYKVYAEISDGLAKLTNNNTKENRDLVQAKINTLSSSDPQKKVFQERLNKFNDSSSTTPSSNKSQGVNMGIESGYYKGHNGSLDYYIYFPPNATTNMPLLLWLHGDNPRIEWITNNKIGKSAYEAGVPVIMVSPYGGADFGHGSNPGWYEGGLLTNLKNIVDDVCEKYYCDKSNINIGGHSRGAIGTWMMVSKYPGFFHAAAPVSCCAVRGFNPQSFQGVKVWAWRGSNKGVGDDNDNIYGNCLQGNINSIKPYAKEVRYTILPNTTHGEATNELQLNKDFARYMFSD